MREYNELVENIKEGFKKGAYSTDFEWVESMEFTEVNPWTYWQGLGVRHPRILLLGQDWGSKQQMDKFCFVNQVQEDDKKVYYFGDAKKMSFASDRNLVKLFEVLGYENIATERSEDLFFTNLIPGFRVDAKSTGGFKVGWITEQVKKDFRDLIMLLQPTVVLCLGKDTFRGAQIALGAEPIKATMDWNTYLSECKEPIKINFVHDLKQMDVHLFALPHPGSLGVNNRGGMDVVKEDWKKVDDWLRGEKVYENI